MRSPIHPGSVLAILALAFVHAVYADEPKAASQPVTVTILHVFQGHRDSAAEVMATGHGVVYGTVPRGGPGAAGLVYRVSPDGRARILHTFSGPDGIYPTTPPVEGADGAIYGAAQFGPTLSPHCGVYRITDTGSFAVVYLLPNPVGGETYVARIRGRSGGLVYSIDGEDMGCGKLVASRQSPQGANSVFSVVSEHKSFACCGPRQALTEWVATQRRLGEELTQLVKPRPDSQWFNCNPERPTAAVTGQRLGAVTCESANQAWCFIYRLDKSDVASIAYRFNVPLKYCRFPGPLVASEDGNLYGAIFDYATPYLAPFRVDVANRANRSEPSRSPHD